MGLDLLLSPDADDYISYVRSFVGIQISIHGQEEYSDNRNLIIAIPGYDYRLFITPSILTSDESVNLEKYIRFVISASYGFFSFSDSVIAA